MTAIFIRVVDDGLAARLRLARFETLRESGVRSRRAWHKHFAVVKVTFLPVCGGKTPSVRITVFRWKLNCSRTRCFDGGFACGAEVTAKFIGPIRETRAFGGCLAQLLAQLEIGYVAPG